MRLIVMTFVSRDGVMQGPGGPDEDHSGGFDQGGWVVPYVDEEMMEVLIGWTGQADAYLLGRSTYDVFAGSWGTVTDPEDPVATSFNSHPRYVASRTLNELGWSGSTLLTGDTADAVAALKREPGRELQVHGSAGLVQTLLEHDLVDEFRILTFPVVLGQGKRLFGDGARPLALEAVEQRTTGNGVTIEILRNAGRPEFGRISVGDEALG